MNFRFFYQIIFTVIFCLNPGLVQAKSTSVGLVWNANPEPDIAGYIIYYGTKSKRYTKTIDTGKVTSYRITGLSKTRTYYFALKAKNLAGKTSEFSDQVKFRYKKKDKSWWDRITNFFTAKKAKVEKKSDAPAMALTQIDDPTTPDSLKPSPRPATSAAQQNIASSFSYQSLTAPVPSIDLVWEPIEGVTEYIVHGSEESKVFQNDTSVKTNHIRVPKSINGIDTHYYTIEAVYPDGSRSFTEEFAVKADSTAGQKIIPWEQTEFSAGTPSINSKEDKINVVIHNNSNNETSVTAPPVQCSLDGVNWQVLVNELTFDVGKVTQELEIPYPKGLVPPKLYVRVEGQPDEEIEIKQQ
jgi:hypothetical protein